MHKSLLIVLLAICLVSVHAFVKRDAPAPASTQSTINFEGIGKDISKMAENIQKNFAETFNADAISKSFNSAVDKIQEVFNKPKTNP